MENKENGRHEIPAFEEGSFWEKIKKVALKAGRELLFHALVLYYCLQDDDTPAWAKAVIIGALVYFVSPFDAIPDFIPVVGLSDDLAVLAAALATIAVHIKQEHRDRANEWLDNMFGEEDNPESD